MDIDERKQVALWGLPEKDKRKALTEGIEELLDLLYPPTLPVSVELHIYTPWES